MNFGERYCVCEDPIRRFLARSRNEYRSRKTTGESLRVIITRVQTFRGYPASSEFRPGWRKFPVVSPSVVINFRESQNSIPAEKQVRERVVSSGRLARSNRRAILINFGHSRAFWPYHTDGEHFSPDNSFEQRIKIKELFIKKFLFLFFFLIKNGELLVKKFFFNEKL